MHRRSLLQCLPLLLLPLQACTSLRAGSKLREFELIAMTGDARIDPTMASVPVWTYGGSVPGPQLRVRQGHRMRVAVSNQLSQPTTVHWHGLRVPNAMDGVPHLTQHPIPPGGRHIYEFDLPDAGTYWYHSHFQSSEQLDRGLYGTVVVEERDPVPVDRDLTWVLDDWRITPAGRISETFGNAHDMAHAGRIGNVVTVNGSVREDFSVRAGERLRLRLVNAANARIFALAFQGHRPLVIAIDGQPVEPHEPAGGRVVIAPGMRCDLLLDAAGRPGERHEVHDLFYPRERYVLMQFVYDQQAPLPNRSGAIVALPANTVPEPDLVNAGTHDIVFEGGMMGALHQAWLDGKPTDMRGMLGRGKAWAVNGLVSDGHDMKPMLELQLGRSYRLSMRNETRWHHPIHLHGHTFRVLARNGRPTEHRQWQDTVLMSPGEQVEIAFVADNPGDWMFHCHILEHQDGGMMSVLRVS